MNTMETTRRIGRSLAVNPIGNRLDAVQHKQRHDRDAYQILPVKSRRGRIGSGQVGYLIHCFPSLYHNDSFTHSYLGYENFKNRFLSSLQVRRATKPGQYTHSLE